MSKKKARVEQQSDQHDSYRSVEMQGHDVPINSRCLGSYIQQDAIAKESTWDGEKFVDEPRSIVRGARADQMTLSHHAVATGRNLAKKRRGEDELKASRGSASIPSWPRYK